MAFCIADDNKYNICLSATLLQYYIITMAIMAVEHTKIRLLVTI